MDQARLIEALEEFLNNQHDAIPLIRALRTYHDLTTEQLFPAEEAVRHLVSRQGMQLIIPSIESLNLHETSPDSLSPPFEQPLELATQKTYAQVHINERGTLSRLLVVADHAVRAIKDSGGRQRVYVQEVIKALFDGEVTITPQLVAVLSQGVQSVNAGELHETALGQLPQMNEIHTAYGLRHMLAIQQFADCQHKLLQQIKPSTDLVVFTPDYSQILQRYATNIRRQMQDGRAKTHKTDVLAMMVWHSYSIHNDYYQQINAVTTICQNGEFLRHITEKFGKVALIMLTAVPKSTIACLSLKHLDAALNAVYALPGVAEIFKPLEAAIASGRSVEGVFRPDEETFEQYIHRVSVGTGV